jgi:hypothetical protein
VHDKPPHSVPLNRHASTLVINAILRHGPVGVAELMALTRLGQNHILTWTMRLQWDGVIQVVGRTANKCVLYDVVGR